MNKVLKGFISVLLALTMIFSVSSVAFAADEIAVVSVSAAENNDGQKTAVLAESQNDKAVTVAEETADSGETAIASPFASIITFFRDLLAFFRTLKAFIDAGMPGLPFGDK